MSTETNVVSAKNALGNGKREFLDVKIIALQTRQSEIASRLETVTTELQAAQSSLADAGDDDIVSKIVALEGESTALKSTAAVVEVQLSQFRGEMAALDLAEQRDRTACEAVVATKAVIQANKVFDDEMSKATEKLTNIMQKLDDANAARRQAKEALRKVIFSDELQGAWNGGRNWQELFYTGDISDKEPIAVLEKELSRRGVSVSIEPMAHGGYTKALPRYSEDTMSEPTKIVWNAWLNVWRGSWRKMPR